MITSFQPLLTLAQVTSPLPHPTADVLFEWLKVACALMAIAALALYVWRQVQGTPPPGDKFATKDEVERMRIDTKDELEKLREEIKQAGERTTSNYNEVMRSAAEGRSRIHKEINDAAALVHRVEGMVETLRETVRDLVQASTKPKTAR